VKHALAARCGVRGTTLLVLLAALCALIAAVPNALAQEPLRTWGGSTTPPGAQGTPDPQEATTADEPAAPAPPAPPVTVGTPTEGSASAILPRTRVEDEGAGVVRTPGRIGLRYTLEGIEVRGNTATLSRVVLRYVPFHPGDTIDVDDKELELTRFRLLGTGFFRDAELSLRRGSKRGQVVLVVTVVERFTLVVNDVWLGLSADAQANGASRPLTAYGGLDVSDTNLAGTGITVGGALALAEGQLALRARFVDPNFLGSSWTAEATLLYNNARDYFGNRDVLVDYASGEVAQDYAVVSYKRFGGFVGAGHDLGVSTQLFVDYRLEKIDATLPLAASDLRGLDVEPIDFQIDRGSSVLSAVRATLQHDTRDEPTLPTRGDNLVMIADLAAEPIGSDYGFLKLQARAEHWFRLPWGHVVRLEGFAGGIFGDAPFFEKFYVGDFSDLLPDRVLGLNVDRRPAPNYLNTDIREVRYGSYAAKLNVEYRYPLYHGHRSIYGVDAFVSGGIYGVADGRDLTSPPRGYSGFATAPIDLTFNLGLRVDTEVGGFLLGVSNILGFLPIRGDAK
jgi:outer membrane protein insertion porin family